jgi:hypothetical protein
MKFENELKRKTISGSNPAWVRRPIGHGGLLQQSAVTASQPDWRGPAATWAGRLGRDMVRAHRPWSPHGGHAHGGRLAPLAASNRAIGCGETDGDSSRRKRGRCRARRDRWGCTEGVARWWGGGVGREREKWGSVVVGRWHVGLASTVPGGTV